ncbi:MAG: bifunctional demethylmenaquinone methyltransferase/2-methoxy-6-polyprenyl-1,4-benzoquinol methylase UbiE [Gammaproteobacteria bacterium]|nr:bifunctional demethylmenaquinone methyltransferase/2-methoxy-6-polyprenyl-1,4-benzoquinol methylase UbiE [Gammaproteobacteria bacterium]
MNGKPETTHFGFEQVPTAEKKHRVDAVFDSVADRYDLMNDLMSLGIHRLWKRFAAGLSGVRRGSRVLDLAGGTGDLAAKFAHLAGTQGEVILADVNANMVQKGRDKLTDKGIIANVRYVQADAEHLPFADNSFDVVSIAFGLRNLTNKEAALTSMLRVLKPGGRLLILEFSEVKLPVFREAYELYSFKLLPWLGKLVAGDADSYRYLAESIRMHPDQKTLQKMMEEAGFERCDYHNLSGGIVALHRGYKLSF